MNKRIRALALMLILAASLTVTVSAGTMSKVGQTNVVSCGAFHAAAIKNDGTLWTWGNNEPGTLGNGTVQESRTPVKVMDHVAAVSCGANHNAAIKTDGTLWMWGSNDDGQLGNGGSANTANSAGVPIQTVPVKIMDDVAAVSCGTYHTAAIKKDGSLWIWGDVVSSQLGNNAIGNGLNHYKRPVQNIPAKVMDSVSAVSSGNNYTAAIKTDGSLWMWGENYYGQLGNGNKETSTVPLKVMDDVSAVSCGSLWTAAIKTDGTLWMWGANHAGQLGNGSTEASTVPVKVMDNVSAVSCGDLCTLVVKNDGSLWAWGSNTWGQFGNGTKVSSLTPVKVMSGVAAVDGGGNGFTVAVKKDGAVWAWGNNWLGMLGNGSTASSSSIPVRVSGLTAKLPGPFVLPAVEPVHPTAYATSYSILVDGEAVAFDAYALKDENGNDTNYLKLRDVAHVLKNTSARFDVGWDGASSSISITTGKAYANPNGSEMSTPFSGNQPYKVSASAILVNGVKSELAAITLTDISGGGYTYFKLRDLGQNLGFYVGWDTEKGAIVIDTTRPYSA